MTLVKSRIVFWLKTQSHASSQEILDMLDKLRALDHCTRDELAELTKAGLGKLAEEGYIRRDAQSPTVFVYSDK